MIKLSAEHLKSLNDSYETARAHSDELDKLLGFKVEKIESELLEEARLKMPDGSHKTWGQGLHDGNQTWVGLSHQTLQTPYNELRILCEYLNPAPGTTMVDLGAGYGRLGLVLSVLFPEVNFIGFEYVGERVKEGQRVLMDNRCHLSQLIEKDLTSADFQLPHAEYYFLYDYGTLSHIRHTLGQLEELANDQKFKVIARGKGTRSIIQNEHPWLSQVHLPHHEEHYSIYSMSFDL